MGTATRQQEVLEELRSQIRRLERRPARREGVLACGRPRWRRCSPAAALPAGPSPRCAVDRPAARPAWPSRRCARPRPRVGLPPSSTGGARFYPPAALALGVDLARLLIVRPEPALGVLLPGLWAAEVLLASGAFPAVVIDVPLRGVPASRAEPLLRRLRAAAEKGGAAALLLSGPGDPAIPAAIRIDLDAVGRHVA